MKQSIREFALSLGVDDIGFASVAAYSSPRSPSIESISPDIKTIIVLAYKELASCASQDTEVAMSGRQAIYEFARAANYRVGRFLESQHNGKAFTVSAANPMAMLKETGGAVGQVSLRHAAYAAGLGVFGSHNLIIHPRFGTRVIFSAVLTNLELPPDTPLIDELCNDCDLCVEACPARALDEKGKTEVNECFKKSMPYGLGGNIAFWRKVLAASPDEQKSLLTSVDYWRFYQSVLVGNQYYCFNCMSVCPIGVTENSAKL